MHRLLLLAFVVIFASACGDSSGPSAPAVDYPEFFDPIVGYGNDVRLVSLHAGPFPGALIAAVQRNGNTLIDIEFELGKRDSLQNPIFYQDIFAASTKQWDSENDESMTEFLAHFATGNQPQTIYAVLDLHDVVTLPEASLLDYRMRVRYQADAASPAKTHFAANHAVRVGPEKGSLQLALVNAPSSLGVGEDVEIVVGFSQPPAASYPVYFRVLEVVQDVEPGTGAIAAYTHETGAASVRLDGIEVKKWEPPVGVDQASFTLSLEQAPEQDGAQFVHVSVSAGGWTSSSVDIPLD